MGKVVDRQNSAIPLTGFEKTLVQSRISLLFLNPHPQRIETRLRPISRAQAQVRSSEPILRASLVDFSAVQQCQGPPFYETTTPHTMLRLA